MVQKGEGQQEDPEAEEEGGISVYLQPGEQVLIGSLNIAVKKFFFHAYLTNQRIFLIDTQEKKVKVTAKDIPRDTIAGSIIEFSESSDPVLVLSLKSTDDEIKTMKLIFIQNGMDRSDEIDEWITLLHEEDQVKESLVQPAGEPSEPLEMAIPVEREKPPQKQELQPKRKPGKDHEKQPPVKRHILLHKVQEQEYEVEEPSRPPRRAQVREVPDKLKKPDEVLESEMGTPPMRKADIQPVRKHEVQSAMKVAMKNAMHPLKSSSFQTVKRPVTEPASIPEKAPETEESTQIPGHPVIKGKVQRAPAHDEGAEMPSFCQNCGKKLPPAANFCPGCGTKLGTYRTISDDRIPEYSHEKKGTHHDEPVREKKGTAHKESIDEEDMEDETQVSTKLPAKKPKRSEMTILHKFLRR
ncbi:MAG: zinc ribbon domain-containing protein [Methanoregula sp.]|nr:zinc ribbon domain-containing protein [Methanoregula sp.]